MSYCVFFLLEAKEVNVTVISRKLCPLPERFPACSQAGISEVWKSQAWWFHCRSFDQSIPACAASFSNPLHIPLNSSFLLPLGSGMCCTQLMSRNTQGLSLTLVSLLFPWVQLEGWNPFISPRLPPAHCNHCRPTFWVQQTFTCLSSKFLSLSTHCNIYTDCTCSWSGFYWPNHSALRQQIGRSSSFSHAGVHHLVMQGNSCLRQEFGSSAYMK